MIRALIQWPQLGHVDYEEWFDSSDIASASLGDVACIIAELYRDLFEVRASLIRVLVWSNHSSVHVASRTEDKGCQQGLADPASGRGCGNLLWPVTTCPALFL
jgi:hypothetical protein